MKTHISGITALVLSLAAAAGCQQKEWTYENQMFISGSRVTNTILKSSVQTAEMQVVAAVAKPVESTVHVAFVADASLVDTYNLAYYDNAVALPEENYTIASNSASIDAGMTESMPVHIEFTGLDKLSLDRAYVLPVTIASADMPVLSSASTSYFVFRGGSIINVVADMEKSNYISFNSFETGAASTVPFRTITDFTMEAMINVREFVPGIQSVMGMEGNLLIRISDNGLEPNQLQVVTPAGNVPTTDVGADVCALTPGEWTHVAVTGNSATNEVIIYFNGTEAYRRTLSSSWGTIDLVSPKNSDRGNQYFHIGYSYASGRELDGMICECRIWNTVRTQEQIAASQYEVDPKSEGLIGYWKFDEGQGSTITDYTENGNNGQANDSDLLWVPVSIPAIGE